MSIGKHKISGIGNYTEDHIAGIVADGGVRMCGKIIKEHVASFAGEDSGLCLIVRDFIEGNTNGGINGSGIVEGSAGDRLDSLLASCTF